MKIQHLSYSDAIAWHQFDIIGPDTIQSPAVADLGREILEAHAAHVALSREREAAADAPQRLGDQAREAAAAAGVDGKTPDVKRILKKKREAEERLEEIDLEWTATGARLAALRTRYLDTLTHYAPALAAEARATADAAILSLASAREIARKAAGALEGALTLLGGLATVSDGQFTPVPPKARRDSSDDFLEGTAPIPYAQNAVEQIGVAIGWAARVLDDLAVDAKARAAQDASDAEGVTVEDADDEEEAAEAAEAADAAASADEDEDDES
jgi:hypothetical protein